MDESQLRPPIPPTEEASKAFVLPSEGEVITSLLTRNSYEIGRKLGEGNFGIVYHCVDVWRNTLAAKVQNRGEPTKRCALLQKQKS